MASASAALWLGLTVLGSDRFAWPALILLPLLVVLAKSLGLYDRDEHVIRKTTLDEAPRLFQLATLYTLFVELGHGYLFFAFDFGADQLVGIWALLFGGMLGARTLARMLVRRLTGPERCLVVGDASAAPMLSKRLAGASSLRAEVVGCVPFAGEGGASDGVAVLGRPEALGDAIREHDVHRVIVSPGSAEPRTIVDMVRAVKSTGVKVSVLPRLFEVLGSAVEMDDVDGITLLGVRRSGLTASSMLLKRLFDVSLAGLGALIVSPLLLAIALAIKLSDRGPVLFRQVRVGRDNKRFEMLKFRTMVEGADEQKAELAALNEADGLFKITDDPRLTRVGRFLRRHSLDELPQLFNVLAGRMSLVGPRPLIPEEDAQVEGWARGRLQVPPGMTGLWQVFGSSRIPLTEMVKIDYLYGANWSPWLDVKILLRTIPYAFIGRGI